MKKLKLHLPLILILASALLSLSGCITSLPAASGVPEISNSEYENLVEKKSKKVEIYDGLYNKLSITATSLDSEMSQGNLAYRARLNQWQEPKFREEKSLLITNHASTTEFFVSFYTPERKHADLSRTKNLWKILLDVDGKRYEGKAVKIRLLLSEVQALYPRHNRWSTPYLVTFPVPTTLVENKPFVLTVTGALGSVQVKFDQ